MLIYPKSFAGFTLIELMIAIAIIGVLLVAGFPEMYTFIQNTKIRSYAETISTGMQLARGEAVKRNTRIQFMLTNNTPNAATLPTLAAGNTGDPTGVNWAVMNYQSTGVYTAADFVQGSDNFSSPNVTVNAGDATIVFNGLGRNDLASATTIQVTNPNSGTCFAVGGPMRCLNIVVQSGGQIRMCDPAITTAGDTRKC
ncbi:MAG TPA: GspH/FimT family pseudopilin [Burkholderiales bacterium]|nr:GspH/FimT family pseudopilin [Burkholderiales bacterium]